MSRDGTVELDWAGESRPFRLGLGEWRRVQERCDCGPGEICERLAPFIVFAAAREAAALAGLAVPDAVSEIARGAFGAWRIDDVRETIHQGLIGGGCKPADALALVRRWVDERPLAENIPIAYAVAQAAILGAEDEKPAGESVAAAEPPPPRSQEASSASARTASTPSAPRPASAPPHATP